MQPRDLPELRRETEVGDAMPERPGLSGDRVYAQVSEISVGAHAREESDLAAAGTQFEVVHNQTRLGRTVDVQASFCA